MRGSTAKNAAFRAIQADIRPDLQDEGRGTDGWVRVAMAYDPGAGFDASITMTAQGKKLAQIHGARAEPGTLKGPPANSTSGLQVNFI